MKPYRPGRRIRRINAHHYVVEAWSAHCRRYITQYWSIYREDCLTYLLTH